MNKAQKKEAANLFAESARLEQLRKIGKRRNPEEQREYSRLYQKSRRRDQRGEESPYDKFGTAQEFWAANRLLLPKKKLDELLEAQETILDFECWMESGFNYGPSDPDFVSLEEGRADIVEHITMFGTIHDHAHAYHSPLLRDHIPNFAVWSPSDSNELYWGRIPAFFKSKEIFDALCTEENEPTEIMARYGIKTALSAYEVREFQRRIAEHKRGQLQPDVRRAHLEFESDRCWLCNYERSKQRDAEGPSPQA